jgi:hypothetical protein
MGIPTRNRDALMLLLQRLSEVSNSAQYFERECATNSEDPASVESLAADGRAEGCQRKRWHLFSFTVPSPYNKRTIEVGV